MTGSWVNTDTILPPYAGGHMLCSSKKEKGSAHTAPVNDASYAPVWTYMLTGTGNLDETAAASSSGCDCPSTII